MEATTTSRRRLIAVVTLSLAACSSNHSANPNDPAATPATAASTTPVESVGTSTGSSPESTSPSASTSGSTTTSSTTSTTTTTTTAPSSLTVTGRAVAGTAGGVETVEPFAQTDPFAEVVRLLDGTCVGWSGSRGGSTVGLAVGTPVLLLEAETNAEVGTGTITASRWEDASAGGGQYQCAFDFAGTLSAPRAEFRIKVGALAPWLARPDPTLPGTFTASVSTDASIGLVPECPAVPAEPDPAVTTTTLVPPPTTVAAPPVTNWSAVGQYWSSGVRSLCAAGLPVTAIARPCRPPGVASEYISAVVDSSDPTLTYTNGTAIPAGTALTVVVATGRPCE